MKLKKLIKKLNEIAKENPESLEMKVIYSIDDEGNAYKHISVAPSIGFIDKNGDFTPLNQFKKENINEKCNIICVN